MRHYFACISQRLNFVLVWHGPSTGLALACTNSYYGMSLNERAGIKTAKIDVTLSPRQYATGHIFTQQRCHEREEPTDCMRRCLSACRAASSFADNRDQRAIEAPPDERDISDPTDVADDADDEKPRPSWRMRRDPCCPFVDLLRAAFMRGTSGIGGRCGRHGGTRDARGSGGRSKRKLVGVCGRDPRVRLLLTPVVVLCIDGAIGAAFGAPPRICTIPAPSRVSSSVHGFETVDIGDDARATSRL